MKRFLFIIFVIAMTPIYVILCVLAHIVEWLTDITEPIADGIRYFVENMVEFWKSVFKRRGEQ